MTPFIDTLTAISRIGQFLASRPWRRNCHHRRYWSRFTTTPVFTGSSNVPGQRIFLLCLQDSKLPCSSIAINFRLPVMNSPACLLLLTSDPDIAACHRHMTKATVNLLCSTHEIGNPEYNFYMCQLLSAAYGVRTLLPELPASLAPTLLKSHWLLIVVVYCIMLRPAVNPELIGDIDIGETSWDSILKNVCSPSLGIGKFQDAQYLKGESGRHDALVIRSLMRW
jgi:hypothetical protein